MEDCVGPGIVAPSALIDLSDRAGRRRLAVSISKRLVYRTMPFNFRKAIPDLPRRPVLVVSDCYPPNTRGGAELSLHLMLSASEHKEDILVVAFNEAISEGRRYQIDGVDVVELPRQAPWPYHAISNAAYAKILAQSPRWLLFLRRFWLTFRYVLLTWPFRPQVRSLAFDIQFLRRANARQILDFDEHDTGLCKRLLRRVVRRVRPRIIHADNFRSIMLAHDLPRKGRRFIGVVRDNRFHCVRPDQSMILNQRLCGLCDVECSEGAGKVPESRRLLMRRSRVYRQEALKRMNRVVVTSHFLHHQLSQFLNQAKLVRIANGSDRVEMVRDATLGVAELPGTNVLVVGMLNDNKGQIELVRALPGLIERVPDLVLHIAGRGGDVMKQIEAEAESLGVADRLKLHGYLGRTQLFQLYAAVQIVALPTVWPEPFGRVPLEAALARRPVVAYRVGGLAETIINERTGILVPHLNIRAFTDALADLANDPERRRSMGAQAADHVLARYDGAKLARELFRLWDVESGKI